MDKKPLISIWIKKNIKSFIHYLFEFRYRNISRKYDIGGYKRIYFLHIPKTGGTSINHMFLSLGGNNPDVLYERISKFNRIKVNDKIFVGWNKKLINRGTYYYAFSHHPFHTLNLPEKTFTITGFRNPAERVISFYNMLMYYKNNDIYHPGLRTYEKYLDGSFADFINRLPNKYLLNQLYMFSENFIIDQALERLQTVTTYFFVDNFSEGVKTINEKTGLELKSIHIRKSTTKLNVSEDTLNLLREKLRIENEFLDYVRSTFD